MIVWQVAGPVCVAADLHGVFFAQRVLDALSISERSFSAGVSALSISRGERMRPLWSRTAVVLGDLIKELLGDGSRGLRQMQAAVEQLLVGFTLQ